MITSVDVVWTATKIVQGFSERIYIFWHIHIGENNYKGKELLGLSSVSTQANLIIRTAAWCMVCSSQCCLKGPTYLTIVMHMQDLIDHEYTHGYISVEYWQVYARKGWARDIIHRTGWNCPCNLKSCVLSMFAGGKKVAIVAIRNG